MIITLRTGQEFFVPGEYLVYRGGEFLLNDLVPVYRRDDLDKTPIAAFPAGYVLYGGDFFSGNIPDVTEKIISAKDVLLAEVNNDPLGIGYASMTADEKVVSLNSRSREYAGTRFITIRTLLAELAPDMFTSIYGKLVAAQQSNPVIALAMEMLKTYADGGGIDICHSNTKAIIDSLVGALLTQEEADAVKALSQTTRAVELIGRPATLSDISEA